MMCNLMQKHLNFTEDMEQRNGQRLRDNDDDDDDDDNDDK